MTTKRWHLIWNFVAKEPRLYDNELDPAGLVDLAADYPDVIEELREIVAFHEAELRASSGARNGLLAAEAAGESKLDPKIAEQLRALGYMN